MSAQSAAPLPWVEMMRDPIWGTIPVTKWERRIIQARPLQRLRDIRQMGLAYVSFMGATHTRLEHSLGTMHAMDILFRCVDLDRGQGPELQEEPDLVRIVRQVLRLVALLHDVGHAPFSHAMEAVFVRHPDLLDDVERADLPAYYKARACDDAALRRDLTRHETHAGHLVATDDGIGQVLRDFYRVEIWPRARDAHRLLGQERSEEELLKENSSAFVEAIARLACAEPAGTVGGLNAAACSAFISADIDVDKLDYLMRDSYNCGARVFLDHTCLRGQIVIQGNRLMLTDRALPLIEGMILARHTLITTIHHETWNQFLTAELANRVADLLSHPKVEEVRGLSCAERVVALHTQWTDADVLHMLTDENQERQWQGIAPHKKSMRSLLARGYNLNSTTIPGTIPNIRNDALVHLDLSQGHPTIAKILYVLGSREIQKRIRDFHASLMKELGDAFGNECLLPVFYDAKMLDFDTPLYDSVGAGDHTILDDCIVRGVMNEATQQCGVAVLGPKLSDSEKRGMRESATEFVHGSEMCGFGRHREGGQSTCIMGDQDCIENIRCDPCKLALALILVRMHRRVLELCANTHVLIPVDFLLIVLGELTDLARDVATEHELTPVPYPRSGLVYEVCRAAAPKLTCAGAWAGGRDEGLFLEEFPLKTEAPPTRFRHELRRGAYIGVFDCIRQVELAGGRWTSFTRRYRLADGGTRILQELTEGAKRGIRGFEAVTKAASAIREVVRAEAEARRDLLLEQKAVLPKTGQRSAQ